MSSMLSASATTLSARHAELDAKIMSEESRPLPDAGVVARLKKAKLLIKDSLRRS